MMSWCVVTPSETQKECQKNDWHIHEKVSIATMTSSCVLRSLLVLIFLVGSPTCTQNLHKPGN